MITDDPLSLGGFSQVIQRLGWPATMIGQRRIAGGPQAWEDVITGTTPGERASLLQRLQRNLLCLTSAGRRRLRQWLDAQRGIPIVIETVRARRQRLAAQLKFFGDEDVFPTVVTVVAALPRPVSDHIIASCAFIVTGRDTLGWATGALPPLRVIALAGHRTDDEIAATARHEMAHQWLLDFAIAPTTVEHAAACEQFHQRVISAVGPGSERDARRFAHALVQASELDANALKVAWQEL